MTLYRVSGLGFSIIQANKLKIVLSTNEDNIVADSYTHLTLPTTPYV